MFYDDTLIPAAKDVSLISWSQLPNPQIPILFEGCETDESWVDEGAVSIHLSKLILVLVQRWRNLSYCQAHPKHVGRNHRFTTKGYSHLDTLA